MDRHPSEIPPFDTKKMLRQLTAINKFKIILLSKASQFTGNTL